MQLAQELQRIQQEQRDRDRAWQARQESEQREWQKTQERARAKREDARDTANRRWTGMLASAAIVTGLVGAVIGKLLSTPHTQPIFIRLPDLKTEPTLKIEPTPKKN